MIDWIPPFVLVLIGAFAVTGVILVGRSIQVDAVKAAEVRAVKVEGHDYIVDGRGKFTHLRSCWCFTNAVETAKGGAK